MLWMTAWALASELPRIPHSCTQPSPDGLLDMEQALQLAKEAGLKRGREPWAAQLSCREQGGVETWIWNVRNTLRIRRFQTGYSSSGEFLELDASTGAVLRTGTVQINACG
jgi:hypothetical protein